MTSQPKPPSGHPEVKPRKIGVLLINLGTPDRPDAPSVRRYLREFLSDPRVVEIPRPLWLPILYGPILAFRPPKTARLYASIWNKEKDESPLRAITRAQAEGVAQGLGRGPRVMVDWAMRYGAPSIPARIQALKDAGCDRILFFPLYPQYSATTTASVTDKVYETVARMRWQPALRQVPPYHDDPAYIAALAASIEAELKQLDWRPDVLVASFHGLPERNLELGDPYHCQCQKTGRLLRERLGFPEGKLIVTFQSRFGRAEWLKPYTAAKVEELARAGTKNLAIVAPGFAADCLETLEELAIGVRETFLHAGGEKFHAVPCLNDSEAGIHLLTDLARRELSGWLPSD